MKVQVVLVVLIISVSSWAQERFEPIGSLYQFQNRPSYVQINGDFVYVGGPESGMSVVDISDRANPLFTEYRDVVGTECILADSLLFVLNEREIHIFEVSNPAVPQFASMIRSYHNNGFAYDNHIAVIFSENRISEGQNEGFYSYNFRIFDLSDAANPDELFFDSINIDGGFSPWGYHPVIVNQILYLWDRRDAALGQHDLSDPSQPIELEDFEINLSPIASNSAGDVLYTSQRFEENQRRFSTIDISNPDNLRMISQIDSLTGYEIEYADTLLFIRNGDSPNVTVLNAADPEEIVLWSQFETQTPNFRISGQSDACAKISNGSQIEIIDLSDPESVVVGDVFDNKGDLLDIDFAGNVGYAASSQDGIRIIDVSDPEGMSEIGLWSNGASIHNLSVENDILYAFGINPVFYILDVSDPANPQELSQFRVNNRILQYYVEDGYIFLSIRDEGISIFDATDPREPALVSTIEGEGQLFRVYGVDLFVKDNDWDDRHIIHHYNFEDRSNPRLIESIPVYSEYVNSSSYLTSFHVEDEFVYFIRHFAYNFRQEYYEWSDFVIVNISDPDHPEEISHIQISDLGDASEYRHTLEDFQNRFAFISSNGVLKVYSTWNRERPGHVATFNGVNRFESMSVLNNYIFVSDYNELLSFDSGGLLSTPSAPTPPLPTVMSLSAYPNPFNASVTVTFDLPRTMPITLKVFDLSGRLVETLVDKTQVSGMREVVWNTGNNGSGVYMLRLETSKGNSIIQRLTLVK